jgi:microcystin-dependent protein
MGNPFVGEIRMFGGNFAPAGWQFCDGSLLPISENETLFNLIGTTYGGDGQSTFAVPDLRGRVPIHFGNGFNLAESGGAESITLTVNQIPGHNHGLGATEAGNSLSPKAAVPATVSSSQAGANVYNSAATSTTLVPASVLPAGGSQPHGNFQPYLCISFIISLFGVFPTPT